MKNQILIIILVAIVLGYLYQQKNQPKPESPTLIKNLQLEVQHYQTLYQKRVAKDLETDQSEKINQLIQTKELYSQKIASLENQLIVLAQTKIKGQKDAEKLLNELETKWDREKGEWEQNLSDLEKSRKELVKELGVVNKDKQQKNKNLLNKLDNF